MHHHPSTPAPRLCPRCERDLLDDIAGNTALADGNWIYCKHKRTLAVAFVVLGKITRWQLNGPLTEQEAFTIVSEGSVFDTLCLI